MNFRNRVTIYIYITALICWNRPQATKNNWVTLKVVLSILIFYDNYNYYQKNSYEKYNYVFSYVFFSSFIFY